jgi:transposase
MNMQMNELSIEYHKQHPDWWFKAAELRQEGLSYREIGNQCGVSYEAVRLAMKSLEINKGPRPASKQAPLEKCPVCGGPKDKKGMHRECYLDMMRAGSRERYLRLEAMWKSGKSIKQIAEDLGHTPGSVGMAINKARKAGFDLPLRRKRETVEVR